MDSEAKEFIRKLNLHYIKIDEARKQRIQEERECDKCYYKAILEVARIDNEIRIQKSDTISQQSFIFPFHFFALYDFEKPFTSMQYESITSLHSDKATSILTDIQRLKSELVSLRKEQNRREYLDTTLKVAQNYTKLNLRKEALTYFKISCKRSSNEMICPAIDNKNTDKMSIKRREKYVKEIRRVTEMEHRRRIHMEYIRRMISHFAMFGDALEFIEPETATKHLKECLNLSREHTKLNGNHDYEFLSKWHVKNLRLAIKIMMHLDGVDDLNYPGGLWIDKNYKYDVTILLNSSLGSLRDLLIELMTEFLTYENDAEMTIMLAKLHGLRRDLSKSKQIFLDEFKSQYAHVKLI